ncbi:MAG: N-acetylmuramoyl-L-alanine amidase [Eubacteriales bacterium]|nr:N-acetylmuramoyl-L-alanine amidase [Eubacteriales bacterium]
MRLFIFGRESSNSTERSPRQRGLQGSWRIRVLLLALLLAAVCGAAAGVTAARTPVYAASKTRVVVLDPGHGGWENGARYYGMKEKILNLKIAKYCRAELQKYAGVKVVMTRTTDKPVDSSGTSADLLARCLIAKRNKADLFVCLHNNAYGAGESKRTNGVRVYYQNKSFSKSTGKKSKSLAKEILKKVAACGLKNGGVHTKYSDDRSRRDNNGRRGDYYAVLYYNKTYRIPAVIVEHAFMSNAGDAAKLKKESFLKRLGQADAAAIARYLELKKK